MPFTHIEIQKERQWKSVLLFILLVLYYFFSFVVLGNVIRIILFIYLSKAVVASPWLTLDDIGICLVVALAVAVIHWVYAITGGVVRILMALRAQSPDLTDRYHKMFQDILDEIQLATGGKQVSGVVIPTVAVNAFALATTEENATIGVTEGLLAKLTRPQLECVIAHEMAHIMNNDCILVTIACSLFATFSQLLHVSEKGAEGSNRLEPWVMVGIIGLLALGAKLLNVAVDRQREFLADATAVRLTRNPTSFAEALMKISDSWRGGGYMDDTMAPIFILNPAEQMLDEKESFWADLFSTHPPTRKRLEVLLQLAHTDIANLKQSVAAQENTREISKAPLDMTSTPIPAWWIRDKEEWKGPFTVEQVHALPIFSPDTWTCRDGTKDVLQASKDALLSEVFSTKLDGQQTSCDICPRCNQALVLREYEGTQVLQCHFCQGYLLNENNIYRILTRREIGFSEQFKEKVKGVEDQTLYMAAHNIKPLTQDPSKLLQCPRCKVPMNRTYYSYQYRVIIDRCYACNLIWFDTDELQTLQVMIQNIVEN